MMVPIRYGPEISPTAERSTQLEVLRMMTLLDSEVLETCGKGKAIAQNLGWVRINVFSEWSMPPYNSYTVLTCLNHDRALAPVKRGAGQKL